MALSIFIALLLNVSYSEHDIHLSICDIEIKEDHISLTLKTFLDDLQLAVGLVPGAEIPKNYSSADEMIAKYISTSIHIQLGDQPVTFVLEDISGSVDAVWITVRVDKNKQSGKLKFTSSFLTELYKDQTNLVNVRNGKEKKSFILDKKKHEFEVLLD